MDALSRRHDVPPFGWRVAPNLLALLVMASATEDKSIHAKGWQVLQADLNLYGLPPPLQLHLIGLVDQHRLERPLFRMTHEAQSSWQPKERYRPPGPKVKAKAKAKAKAVPGPRRWARRTRLLCNRTSLIEPLHLGGLEPALCHADIRHSPCFIWRCRPSWTVSSEFGRSAE